MPQPRALDSDWDDEAWASQSDDEDFVSRIVLAPTHRDRPVAEHAPDMWLPISVEDDARESEQRRESTDEPPVSAPVPPEAAPANVPQADGEAANDERLAAWVEERLRVAPEAAPEPRRRSTVGRLDAQLVDPMTVLESFADQLHEEPEEIEGTHDVADEPRVDVFVQPEFDPLSTLGDGVFTTISPVERVTAQAPRERRKSSQTSQRNKRTKEQLLKCLQSEEIDLSTLRGLAWMGVPNVLRPIVWQLLLGYLPANASTRRQVLAKKRAEYAAGVERAFARGTAGLDRAIWHQIYIDVPRTNPGIALWQQAATQRALERILYVWAIRHPASGYVQGINDLATPFFEVFLSAYVEEDPEHFELAKLPAYALEAVEADTFWCLSKLLDAIHDNYIFAQPGIQRQVRRMSELVARIDAPLHAHLAEQNVEYMQFAFRWMNCLLMREMSVKNIIRIWDTYLAEGTDAFADFHPFVCAVFLHMWSDSLMRMDFQGIIMFLQSLPTQDWCDRDAELLLSEAFMYKSLFGNTAHLHK
ncbi:GTPase-activating protein [Malassezia cuniculi]|uniref:GTPase-activating protein n=1 Tax=Malassezia cuniculi TaxID=948313 RepID=A0AAF0J5W6_9BASI|nr:GTPase-activating protein [Malassezia cuniculi]